VPYGAVHILFDALANAGLASVARIAYSWIASAIVSATTVIVMRLALPTGTRYNHPA
jgi:hypothetical protein